MEEAPDRAADLQPHAGEDWARAGRGLCAASFPTSLVRGTLRDVAGVLKGRVCVAVVGVGEARDRAAVLQAFGRGTNTGTHGV